MTEDNPLATAVELATELTIAWLSNPNTRAQANEVPEFLRTMHEAVTGLTTQAGSSDGLTDEHEAVTPAVSVRKRLPPRTTSCR